MKSDKQHIALILAGGVGSRVGLGVPKQFVEVLGKPVLAYTIEAYQNHPDINGIEVVCVASYMKDLKDLCVRQGYTKVKWTCEGGADFQHSVMNGVENLRGKIAADDIVMIHYGAAPFTSERIITDAIRVAHEHGSSVSATPCFQLMGTNDDGASTQWVDRDKLIQIACPQSFRYDYLLDIYARAEKQGLIDKIEPHTTSLMYALGDKIWLSYGDQSNIKVTTKEDIDIFKGWVLLKQSQQKGLA